MKRLLLLAGIVVAGCLSQVSSYELDVETLEDLTYTTITTPDPHLDAKIEYGGVLLKDVLDHFGVEGAQEVTIFAEDGYSAVIQVEDLDLGILLAYKANGEYIPHETGGSIKVIFSEEAQKVYAPENWVWWVERLEPG
jgi:hypothetical protein